MQNFDRVYYFLFFDNFLTECIFTELIVQYSKLFFFIICYKNNNISYMINPFVHKWLKKQFN